MLGFWCRIMGLHLIKMAAGIASLPELEQRQSFVRARQQASHNAGLARADQIVHVTRFFPKRREEILAAHEGVPGSLYWVFQKSIQARQEIADFVEVTGEDGQVRCGIVLTGPLVSVERSRRKAFQGWRYLPACDAPADLKGGGRNLFDIPMTMRRDLEELCLI